MSDPIEIRAFDFHCHVDLFPEPVQLIEDCEKHRIFTLAVTTTPKAWPQNLRWTASASCVRASPGLHPELVGVRYQEVSLLERCISESRIVGEVGLDGSPQHRKSWPRQIDVFARALRAAEALGGRVVSIHSRRAASEVVDMIGELTTPDRTRCILHWFSGSIAIAQRAAALGCYFSTNHRMLEHEQGLALVRCLPSDRLLTETDGPFTHQGGRKCVPADVMTTMASLARARGVSTDSMDEVLRANSYRVLRFAGVDVSEAGCSRVRSR